MAGVTAMRKIQFGRETTAGTAVVCTTIWRGEGLMSDDRTVEIVNEPIGYFASAGRSYSPKLHAMATLDEVPATFEQLPIILECGIKLVTTGAVDTGGSGKIYFYDCPQTTANTVLTVTIEGGDNQRCDETAYGHVESFTLSGASGEAVMMGATFTGRDAADAEFTSTATLPAVEEILFGKGKLWIDSTTLATTTIANSWLGFTLDWPSGWKEVFTGDGNLYFSKLEYVGHKENPITGTITLEHDTNGENEFNNARANIDRLVRMRFEGDALTTAGSSYTYKTLLIDMAIRYTDVPEIEDQNGDSIITLPFQVVISTAADLVAEMTVVNELTTVI